MRRDETTVLPGGEKLIVEHCDGEVTVWLEVRDLESVEIGSGDTREEAIARAATCLEAALEAVQAPPQPAS